MSENIKKIQDENLDNVSCGLYYAEAEGYLFKHFGAKFYNCYIDEGINPEDMIYEHLNEQQIAEYRDILEKGTASPYYIPF